MIALAIFFIVLGVVFAFFSGAIFSTTIEVERAGRGSCFIPACLALLAVLLPVIAAEGIRETAEGSPIYYTDTNGLRDGSYRVVATFEDNGRPYLAAVKDGEEQVKVYALYEPLPTHTQRIKVDEGSGGPRKIIPEKQTEDGGQK